MSFSVKFPPTKKYIFEKSDEECRKLAETLRSTGEVFVDPEFPPNGASLGTIEDRKYFEKSDAPWYAPHEFDKNWSVYNDPWPFEIAQGDMGDCWLIAVLMCIAQRKEILEHVLPPRDYNFDCGIVQVRLFIDGEWQVIKIDYHIPQIDGKERFVESNSKEFWAAFIEKAFAKLEGGYAELNGGHTVSWAFECLTGNPCRSIAIKKKYCPDGFWKFLIKNNSSSYLMAAGTHNVETDLEKKKYFENSVLETNHAYSILDVKEQNGNRLILIEVSCKYHLDDKKIESRVFWLKFEEFLLCFGELYVCKYTGILEKQLFSQTIKRTVKQDCQVLRLDTQQRQTFRIEVISEEYTLNDQAHLYLNIHRATTNNKCGEVLMSVEDICSGRGGASCVLNPEISFFLSHNLIESITLDPGSYFLVFIPTEHSNNEHTLDWTVESSTTLENVSISFVNFPCTFLVESLQGVIMKYGEREEIEKEENDKEKIVVYIWKDDYYSLALVENNSNSDYVRIKSKLLVSDPDDNGDRYYWNVWCTVPPNTRSIVAHENAYYGSIDNIEEFKVSSWSQLPSDFLGFLSEWYKPYFFTPLSIEPTAES
ncbi:hypothetical protein GCK72_020883 [Caenorhabditis remanei]|uniref:Calpain catalytic domain-containing protein n=1 Tax=Caenorhabditis remanei TaxID=31234 RepID=A0A6A5GI16_CAERE|nr:hypothetical protein GCK72_020883 [Caenorhabditis remanei]KAF1754323.1 hypothetical protein GCK72_020883 [Caenorhabditis remanei]